MLTHSTVNLASVQTHRALAAACDVKVGEVRERERAAVFVRPAAGGNRRGLAKAGTYPTQSQTWGDNI